jgi:hypothetical protein
LRGIQTMDSNQTRSPYSTNSDVGKMKYSRRFYLTRDLTDAELDQVYRLVPPDSVDFYTTFEIPRRGIDRSVRSHQYVRFEHWYNLPFKHQTFLELLLPCE